MNGRPSCLVIGGLPGSGKTRLALHLAARIAARDQPVLVAHTDILKISLRPFEPALKGPAYQGNPLEKAARVRPYLQAQADKAEREGYLLILEGTLTLGFAPPGGLPVQLRLAEEERRARLAAKHPSARLDLQTGSLQAYHHALLAQTPPACLILDAGAPVETLATRIEQALAMPLASASG